MSGGKTQPTTSTTNTTPWAPQGKQLEYGYDQARSLFDAPGPEYFPGQSVVPMAGETEQGLQGMMAQAGKGGNPLIPQASGELSKVMSGGYLDPNSNPWLKQMGDTISGDVRRWTDSQFGMAGGAGSGSHAESLGRGISTGLAGLYGGAYENERGRMMGAAGMAPGMARAASDEAYGDANAMLGVGGRREDQSAAALQDLMNRYNYTANLPQNKLSQFMGNVGGGGFNTTTQTGQLTGKNRLSGALGGAATGAALGSVVPVIGTGIGAAAGGLIGYFG